MSDWNKTKKSQENKAIVIDKMPTNSDDYKNLIKKVLGDISTKSASAQILIGASSGW